MEATEPRPRTGGWATAPFDPETSERATMAPPPGPTVRPEVPAHGMYDAPRPEPADDAASGALPAMPRATDAGRPDAADRGEAVVAPGSLSAWPTRCAAGVKDRRGRDESEIDGGAARSIAAIAGSATAGAAPVGAVVSAAVMAAALARAARSGASGSADSMAGATDASSPTSAPRAKAMIGAAAAAPASRSDTEAGTLLREPSVPAPAGDAAGWCRSAMRAADTWAALLAWTGAEEPGALTDGASGDAARARPPPGRAGSWPTTSSAMLATSWATGMGKGPGPETMVDGPTSTSVPATPGTLMTAPGTDRPDMATGPNARCASGMVAEAAC